MTREELLRALYEPWGYDELYDLIERAREQIEADGKRIAELEAENARLRKALIKEREENLWRAYGTGYKSYGRWTHMGLADGEWLARECGFDPTLPDYDANEIKAAIPKTALKVLEEIQQNNE